MVQVADKKIEVVEAALERLASTVEKLTVSGDEHVESQEQVVEWCDVSGYCLQSVRV